MFSTWFIVGLVSVGSVTPIPASLLYIVPGVPGGSQSAPDSDCAVGRAGKSDPVVLTVREPEVYMPIRGSALRLHNGSEQNALALPPSIINPPDIV